MALFGRERIRTVGALESALLTEFPAKDAESWDHTGLIAGDPGAKIQKVAVALDPTNDAILRAAEKEANVLVTHHPLRLNAEEAFVPAGCGNVSNSSIVWNAIDFGVALMNFHTSLDVSAAAQRVLPSMLGLKQTKVLQPIEGTTRKGYGQVCSFLDADNPTLGAFANRCVSVFGRPPRVWGAFDTQLSTVVTCLGSAGDCARVACNAGYDAVVCGEIKYHEALALYDEGLCIIELGHDVSELPLVGVLASAIEKIGVSKDDIICIDQNANWCVPGISAFDENELKA